MLYNVKIRYEVINQMLFYQDKYFKTLENWSQKDIPITSNLQSPIYVIKVLSILHIQLNDVIGIINKIFAVPIMFLMAHNLSGLTFSLYETFDQLFTQTFDLEHIGFNINVYLLTVHLFAYIVATVYLSSSTLKIRDDTNEVLTVIQHRNIDKNLRKKIKIFLLQIKSSKDKFSCGLFRIDWQLIFSVIINFQNESDFLKYLF
jgi:hypothetical protein